MRWALVVLVAVVLVGIWVLVYFLPDLRWFAELLTAVVVVVAALVVAAPWARDRIKRREEDRASEAGQKEEGERQARAELRARLRKSFAEVDRLRRGGTPARKLPWYLVVGSHDSGRTTMLERSGLTRVVLARDSALGEPATPLRFTFDVWCSRDTVIVDASAPGEDLEATRDAWLLILEEIKRIRRARPVEGVLVTTAVGELSAPEAELRLKASRLRARIDDVLDKLDVLAPVYVIVTKADVLPGFVEFWTGFGKPDDSTWGMSWSSTDEAPMLDPGRAVNKEVETLAHALHARLLDRLPAETDPGRRLRTFQFPLEFRRAVESLPRLIEELCRPGAAAERFLLRGIYFVSAAPAAAAPGERYFLTDLFRSVIFPDRNLASPSRRARRYRASGELRGSLIALGLGALVLGPALFSYQRNVEVTRAVRAAAAALRTADPASSPGTRADPIEAALEALDLCDDQARGISIPGLWSPRAARELRGPLSDAYVARLHAWMSSRLRQQLDGKLTAIASGALLPDVPTSVDDQTPLRDAYSTVEMAAILANPKEHASRPGVAERLAILWQSALPAADAVPTERLVQHARNYLAALSGDSSLAWPPGHPLDAARQRLRRLDVRGMPYRRILLAAKDAPAVRASAIFSPTSLEFLSSRGDVQVPGAFTANGWPKIREALRSPGSLPPSTAIEGWVLDDSTLPRDDAALRAQVLQSYFEEYIRRWMSFLDELRVKTPGDIAMASTEIAALKEGDGFYKILFDTFKQNTIHDDAPDTLAALGGLVDAGDLLSKIPWFGSGADSGAAAKARSPSPVEKAFLPMLLFAGMAADVPPPASGAPLDKYVAILDKLKAVLDAPPDPSVPPSSGRAPFNEASTGVKSLLDSTEEPTRGRLWRLLMPPVMGGAAAVKAEGENTLSADWKSAVWTVWSQKLKDHFPFSRTAHAEAAEFAQFSTFFKQDGLLWGFVHARLADRVEEAGDGHYTLKTGAEATSPELLSCLTVAQEITDAFFPAGEDPGMKISLQADWTATGVTDAKFWNGTKDTALPRAQWAGPIRWLGEDVRVEWQEDGRPTQELGRHSFSMYDLFQHLGGLRPSDSGRGGYVVDCPPLTLKVRPEGRVDALRPDFFGRLHCPAEIGGVSR